MGGDGTILRAVRFTAPAHIPIVGINMGRLGFMTELTVDEAMPRLPGYLKGGYRVDERNMLQATVTQAGSTLKEGPYHALNDFVVARGAASRVVSIAGTIDGAQISTFRADGLILSTATGSTGYNLAVGGPILDPESDALVLKTVAAHMGLTAALVLRSGAEVSLQLEGYQPAVLSVDGYEDYDLQPGDRVDLSQSPYKATFLRANPPSYFLAPSPAALGSAFEASRRYPFCLIPIPIRRLFSSRTPSKAPAPTTGEFSASEWIPWSCPAEGAPSERWRSTPTLSA